MIVIGSNSEVAQAFTERVLSSGKRYPAIYLLTSDPAGAERFAAHLEVKFLQASKIIFIDLTKELDFQMLDEVNSELVFCAAGYLGKDSQDGLYDLRNTQRIIEINYAGLVPLLNFFAQKMEARRGGSIIGLSSVAGDRGRQSNFIYGSAKAGFSAYLSGLRNYLFDKKVHVLTVKPGFMATKMTEGMPLNPMLTATPEQAANHIFKAWQGKKNIAYILPVWWLIMMIIRNIPEFIFKKMKL